MVPVVLRRRVWQLAGARRSPSGLELTYRGPGGTWHLRLPVSGRAHTLDATGPGLTRVTVVFPDGCTVRCVGDASDRFVPLPPHSDSVAALLPPMAHASVDQLVMLLEATSVRLQWASPDGRGRHRGRRPRTHAA